MPKTQAHNEFSQIFIEAHDKFAELAKQVQMKLSGMDRKKWDSYSENVETVFDLVFKKIDEARMRCKEEGQKGNYKEAAKSMGHTLQACVKGLKVAMVDIAESLGITRILRSIGIVKNEPNTIMDNLKKEVKKIGPTLVDHAQAYFDETKKGVKKFADKAKKSGKDAIDTVKSHLDSGRH